MTATHVNLFTLMQPYTIHLPTVTSTNDYAKELLVSHPYVMVSAEHQKAGRGRNGKVWIGDEHKNIYCSFGVRHVHPLKGEMIHLWMAIGALAVLDTLRTVAPTVHLRLKYPNDVQVREQSTWAKISGVLVEHEFLGQSCTSSVIGIGINVEQSIFPETIEQPCTSLYRIGSRVDVSDVLTRLRASMDAALLMTSTELSSRWISELHPHTTRFRIIGEEGVWMMKGIGSDGRLHAEHTTTHIERIISDGDTLRYED